MGPSHQDRLVTRNTLMNTDTEQNTRKRNRLVQDKADQNSES